MYRVLIVTFLLFLIGLTACSQPPAATQSTNANAQTTPTATPAASPSVMAVAPTLVMPSPGASGAPPVPPNLVNPKDGKTKGEPQPLPPAIGDRLRRALTLEEINQLPPETRDMILRAQGRLPASPSPAAKKK